MIAKPNPVPLYNIKSVCNYLDSMNNKEKSQTFELFWKGAINVLTFSRDTIFDLEEVEEGLDSYIDCLLDEKEAIQLDIEDAEEDSNLWDVTKLYNRIKIIDEQVELYYQAQKIINKIKENFEDADDALFHYWY